MPVVKPFRSLSDTRLLQYICGALIDPDTGLIRPVGGGGGSSAWGGITGTLSDQTDLQAALDLKENLANKATDFSVLNNTLYPTTLAVNTLVSSVIAASDAMVFKGVIDASTNPNYPAADRGWTYRISVAGKIGGASGPNVEAGDLIICLTDGTASGDHATVGTSWTITQTNLDGVVIGPATATDGRYAQFDGVTGKLIKVGTFDGSFGSLSGTGAVGTVTSVAVTGANGIGISGSPITTNGTIGLSLGNITPTSVAATGDIAGTSLTISNTLSGSQSIGTFLAPNLADGSSVRWVLGRNTGLNAAALFSFIPNATQANNKFQIGHFGESAALTIFRSASGAGGVAIGNGVTVVDPGSTNLSVQGKINGLTLTALATGFTIAGGTTSKTLTVPLDASVSGTNTGDQTSVTGNAGTATALQTPRSLSITGDVTWTVTFDGSANVTAAGTIAAGVVTFAKLATSTWDNDTALAADSATRLPTQHAVKTYVDQLIAASDAMVFKGVIDASTNPNYPAADRGHTYRISVAGKIGGASGTNVEAGDLIICLTDGTAAGTQAAVGANWTISQTNLDGAVIGPASATDGRYAQFDGVTGKLIKVGAFDGSFGTLTGIPSYQPLDGDLTSLSAATGTNTIYYRSAVDTWSPVSYGPGFNFAGGVLRFIKYEQQMAPSSPDTVIAAATLDLTGLNGPQIDVTGNTPITAITLAPGEERTLRFTGTPTITPGAALDTPGGAVIPVTVGGFALVRGMAGSSAVILEYSDVNNYSRQMFNNIYMGAGGNIGFQNTSVPFFDVGKSTTATGGNFLRFTDGDNIALLRWDNGAGVFLDVESCTTIPIIAFPNHAGTLATQAGTETLTNKTIGVGGALAIDTITIDTGANEDAAVDGLVFRNDTPATALVPQQNAPVVLFEAHGWKDDEGDTADVEWEMQEAFSVSTGATPTARFSWLFSQDEGAYEEKSYIDSEGTIWAEGAMQASGFGLYIGGVQKAYLTGNGILNHAGAPSLAFDAAYGGIFNYNLTTPLFLQSYNTTVSAFNLWGPTLTSGHLLLGMAPTSGFTGSYLKFGTSADGDSFSVVKFEVTAVGDLTMAGALAAANLDDDVTMAADSSVRFPTQHAAKTYSDNIQTNIRWKLDCRVASTANVNISSAPASVDSVTLSSGDRVLLKNQSTASQNGPYQFNGTGNAMTRTTDGNTGAKLISATFPIREGTVNQDSWWTITNDTITIGSTSIVFTQTGGAGTYTNGAGLSLTGNSFAIAAGGVTFAMLATAAWEDGDLTTVVDPSVVLPTVNATINYANGIISAVLGAVSATGYPLTAPVITGLPTGSGIDSAATPSTLVSRDANGNINVNSVNHGYATTAMTGGTTTLTVASANLQYFTGSGSTAQTCKLPVTSTLVLGQRFIIINNSTGTGLVTVHSSGANTIKQLAPGTQATFTCILISGTGTASWDVAYFGTSVTGAKKLTVTNTLTLGGTDGTTITFPATGVGYATGAGGTVTQTTSRVTGVTINKLCGKIQTDTTSLAALAIATFTVTNSTVAIDDTIQVSVRSGTTNDTTVVRVSAVAAGSFNITVHNLHAVTAETGAIVINFAVYKAVVA